MNNPVYALDSNKFNMFVMQAGRRVGYPSSNSWKLKYAALTWNKDALDFTKPYYLVLSHNEEIVATKNPNTEWSWKI